MTARVFILLPVHNRREITEHFIDSLLSQTYENYHLILIDDGSTDGTADMVGSKVPADKLTVIKGKGNWWWAGSLQQGINWLRKHDVRSSDVILMINDDVIFKPDYLENGVRFIQQQPNSLLLSRFYDGEKDEILETGVKADLRSMSFIDAETPKEINCLSTRGLFLSWHAIEKIGDFHPILLPHYFSDYEYTIRALGMGLELKTVSSVYIVPNHDATGIRDIDNINSLRSLFSKRCVLNPVYRTVFILLTSPIQYLPFNLVKTVISSCRLIMKIILK